MSSAPPHASDVFVLIGSTGEVEMTTDEGQRWLDHHGIRDALRAAALRVREEPVQRASARVRAASGELVPVELVRLRGRAGERFLVVPASEVSAPSVEPRTASGTGRPIVAPRRTSGALSASDKRQLLSPTQQRVSEMLLAGASLAEIASSLGVDPETVKLHTKHIYSRLGVGSRVELARALEE